MVIQEIKKEKRVQLEDPTQILLDYRAFEELSKLVERMESLIETIDIKNNKELMEGLKKSREDLTLGKVYELKNFSDLWR
jgi:hypothetical protein